MKRRKRKTFPTKDELLDLAMPIPVTGCWIWMGATARGYGVFGRRVGDVSRSFLVRRIMCDAPEGLEAMHSCDTPLCINPDHLRAGTPAENTADKVLRDRVPKGTELWWSKLDESMVREIRSLNLPSKHIAEIYGVSRQCIRHIKAGRTWAHVI